MLTSKIGPFEEGELIPRSPDESDKILIDVYVKSGHYSQEEAERMVTEARKEMNQEKKKKKKKN